MSGIEKYISPYIAAQFPEIYSEEGPAFIQFLKCYFEYMEQEGGVINETRSLLEYRDIDTTKDEFLKYFSDKYMSGIPADVLGDKRLLQKHIKEVFGSKGTIRGLQLLFRLLYNEDVEVYYPSDDILKPSDGVWISPVYVEISSNPTNVLLINETITGRESGATAVVEDFQVRYVNRRQINVLFLSNVRGNFQTGELLLNPINTNPLDSPSVIGSLTDILINESGFNYKIGDILDVVGGSGILGKAVVSGVSPRNGAVEFTIIDGGSGYANNDVFAPTTVTVEAVEITNPGAGATFQIGRLANTEIIRTAVDIVGDYVNVTLDSADYGFPGPLAEDVNTPLDQALSVHDITVGTIVSLYAINPGAGYNGPVTVTVRNDVIAGLNLTDPVRNNVKGMNAIVNGEAAAGNGAIDSVKIQNAGLGYANGDVVQLFNANVPFVAGGTIRLGRQGVGEGYWKDTRSFLNSDKYIQDSYFYQAYSYQVRIALAFDRYSDLLKKIWHPAGTEMFGKVVVINEVDSGSSIEEVKIDAIYLTTYMTSYATFIATDRMTSTTYQTQFATNQLTLKNTDTFRGTQTQVLSGLPELVVNGTFPVDLSNWTTADGTVAWDGTDAAMAVGTNGTTARTYQAVSTIPGRTYFVGVDVTVPAGAEMALYINTGTALEPGQTNAVSTVSKRVTVPFIANNTTTYVHIAKTVTTGDTVLVDNISVKQLPEESRDTVYQTSRATDTAFETLRSTTKSTGTVYDTAYQTNFITQRNTLSAFDTVIGTARGTTTTFNTFYATNKQTNRLTDTIIDTAKPTNRDTNTVFDTTYDTTFDTSRNTTTTGQTAYSTNAVTITQKNTIFDTFFSTTRLTNTAYNTQRPTDRLTDTTISTTYITDYSTTRPTSILTNTTRATDRTTTFATTYNTAYISTFATLYNTSKVTTFATTTVYLVQTSAGAARATGTSAEVGRATTTSRGTTTSFNTSTVFQTSTTVYFGTNTTINGSLFPINTSSVAYFQTARDTGTSRGTTTIYLTTTTYTSFFNTTTSYTSFFNTNYSRATDTSRTTTYDTSGSTTIAKNRDTTAQTSRNTNFITTFATTTTYNTTSGAIRSTSRNTSYATSTSYQTQYDTIIATATVYDTSVATNRATDYQTLTIFDTVIATNKQTATAFGTNRATTISTNRLTNTLFNTIAATAYGTTTTFQTVFDTAVVTQKITNTQFNTAYLTSTVKVTDVLTNRDTFVSTTRATTTTFNTRYVTVGSTSTTYATDLVTTYVVIPTTFQTYYATSTLAPTAIITGRITQRDTSTEFDTAYVTERITSVNTSTDLEF